MFCQNCGNEIPDRAKFCNKCGAAVNAGLALAKGEKPQTEAVIKNTNRKRGYIGILMAVIICCLVAGAGCALLMVRPDLIGNQADAVGYKKDMAFELEASSEYGKDDTAVKEHEIEDDIDGGVKMDDEADVGEITDASEDDKNVAEDIYADDEAFSLSDEEAAVGQIREWYYSPSDKDRKITIDKGTGGLEYSREYSFHEGKLYFAFVYNGSEEEHRLYFIDDRLIRYIDNDKRTCHYDEVGEFEREAESFMKEAYRALEEAGNDVE